MPRTFASVAQTLWQRGYTFDYLSDQFLQEARCVDGRVVLGGHAYRVVLVPHCRLLSQATLRRLVLLAGEGATILFQDSLPADVPGLGELEKRRAELRETLRSIPLTRTAGGALERATVGKGMVLVGPDVEALLRIAQVAREPAVELGLRFVRRTHPEGFHYFLANRSTKAVDGWVPLGVSARSAVLLDPRFANRTGVLALRRDESGSTQVYLQLQPGESCIVRTFTDRTVEGPRWQYLAQLGTPARISGTWKVQFLEGGPELPPGFETRELASWTKLGDRETQRFAGTARYTIEFDRPTVGGDEWQLDLGKVCESARVRLNGQDVGTLWCEPFRLTVGGRVRPGKNMLEVEVTNLAANRIADLDRRKVNWKYFYDANLASRRYRALDASTWPLQDSGLLGPVTLTPVKQLAVASTRNP
jgi:hypothetical protein